MSFILESSGVIADLMKNSKRYDQAIDFDTILLTINIKRRDEECDFSLATDNLMVIQKLNRLENQSFSKAVQL